MIFKSTFIGAPALPVEGISPENREEKALLTTRPVIDSVGIASGPEGKGFQFSVYDLQELELAEVAPHALESPA